MATESPSSPYIEFKHVSKAFGENRVLDDVSFEVRDGETVCILGRSGVGKSVSLHNIMGFLKPDAGRVIVAHQRSAVGGNSQEGHYGLPEWSAV